MEGGDHHTPPNQVSHDLHPFLAYSPHGAWGETYQSICNCTKSAREES